MTERDYTQLQQLHEKYHQQGLEIIAFPCNQFGAQEPGTPEEIYKFATEKFNAGFRLMEKVEVNGFGAHPVFVHLKDNTEFAVVKRIKWNFTKFLVDRDGAPVARFEPDTPPNDMIPMIEMLLANAAVGKYKVSSSDRPSHGRLESGKM